MTELEQFRAQKDMFFKTRPQSPLLPEQQNMFEGLRYFPENPALQLVVPIEEFVDKDRILMQTSTGDVRPYARYGRLRFSVDEQAVELTLYADDDSYFTRKQERKGLAARFHAGGSSLHELAALVADAGFVQVDMEEMRPARFSAFPGAGFVRAYKSADACAINESAG